MATLTLDKPIDKPTDKGIYVIDRLVYGLPGGQPHRIGDRVEFEHAQVFHLVARGFMHREGDDIDPLAASTINAQGPSNTIGAPLANAPQAYQKGEPGYKDTSTK